jgi:hypothetical protein
MFLFLFVSKFHLSLLKIIKNDFYSVYKLSDNTSILNAIKSNLEFYFIFEPLNILVRIIFLDCLFISTI